MRLLTNIKVGTCNKQDAVNAIFLWATAQSGGEKVGEKKKKAFCAIAMKRYQLAGRRLRGFAAIVAASNGVVPCGTKVGAYTWGKEASPNYAGQIAFSKDVVETISA